MFLESALTLLNVVDKTISVGGKVVDTSSRLFNWFTGIRSGDEMNRFVNQLPNTSKIVRLSDKIFYIPEEQQAINKEIPTQQASTILKDPHEIYRMLDPLAGVLEKDILASAVIATPEKLRNVFKQNPWSFLMDVRPVNYAVRPTNADMVPIIFYDRDIQYVGWQTRGALSMSLDCDFESNGRLLVPSGGAIKTSFPQQQIVTPSTNNYLPTEKNINTLDTGKTTVAVNSAPNTNNAIVKKHSRRTWWAVILLGIGSFFGSAIIIFIVSSLFGFDQNASACGFLMIVTFILIFVLVYRRL